jgi:hypothetical protein
VPRLPLRNKLQRRNTYGTRHDTWPDIVEALKKIGATEISRQTGFSRSSINEILSGRARPHPRRQPIYEELARRHNSV